MGAWVRPEKHSIPIVSILQAELDASLPDREVNSAGLSDEAASNGSLMSALGITPPIYVHDLKDRPPMTRLYAARLISSGGR